MYCIIYFCHLEGGFFLENKKIQSCLTSQGGELWGQKAERERKRKREHRQKVELSQNRSGILL